MFVDFLQRSNSYITDGVYLSSIIVVSCQSTFILSTNALVKASLGVMATY